MYEKAAFLGGFLHLGRFALREWVLPWLILLSPVAWAEGATV
jgi:hypothetical protein